MGVKTFYKHVFAWFDRSLAAPIEGLPGLVIQQSGVLIKAASGGRLGEVAKLNVPCRLNSIIQYDARLVSSVALRMFLFSPYVLRQFSSHSTPTLSFWTTNLSQFLRAVLLRCRVPVFTLIPQRLVAHQPLTQV